MKFIDTASASPAPTETTEVNANQVQQTSAHATTEASAETGVLASLGINGSLFVAQLINFALVATILWFLILKPLTKKMTERQKMIDESLENAKKIDANLLRSEQKYQEKIDEAKTEANKIMEKAVTDTTQVTEAMKEKARMEIEALVEQAKRNIANEKKDMVTDLRKYAADLVVNALEKILAEKVDAAKDKQIIEEMITKLK